MYQKFIINQDGVLKFGHVYLHRDLLEWDETAPYGGGLWKIDNSRSAIILYGRSFDFGKPDISQIRSIAWSSLSDRAAYPLFYAPFWPDESTLIPIQ